jgi:low affinity Fe/Cu permease
MNEYEYNQMLTILTGAGILSKETGIQKNTESTPDEIMRIEKEKEKTLEEQQAMMEQQAKMAQQNNSGNKSNQSKGKEEE